MKQNNCSQTIIKVLESINTQAILLSMLHPNDLVTLLTLSKQTKEDLISNTQIINNIYYHTFLKQRDLFTYAFYESTQYKAFQQSKIDRSLILMEGRNIGAISIMKTIKQKLIKKFKLLLGQQESLEIVADIFETMIEPSIPRPSLRKQTIGDYCNSSLQILMAEFNWRDNSFDLEDGPYLPFKIALLENHQQILDELKSNKNRLLDIRFQAQLIFQYQSTDSALLDIITLFLVLIDYHIEAMRKYLECYQNYAPFEFLTQFIKRYTIFRDMVVGFQNKLGFMMELFTKAFNFLEPELEIYPGCSLWRCLMKKWVIKMMPFNGLLAKAFNQLLIKVREANFHQMIQNQKKLQNLSANINCRYMLNKSLNEKYEILSEQLDIIQKQDQHATRIILSQYVEYLVDSSLNEYSVHWCQNSSQKLSSIFNINEGLILESTQVLYENWRYIFQGNDILREALQKDVECLRDVLKPTTLSKIVCQANNILIQTFSKPKTIIKGGFQKLDNRIRAINQKRQIPLQLLQQYKQFFDLDRTICLDKIQSIIQKARLERCDTMEPTQGIKSQKSVIYVEDS